MAAATATENPSPTPISIVPTSPTSPAPAPSPITSLSPVAAATTTATEFKLLPPIVVESVWPQTEEEKKYAQLVAKFRAHNAAYIEENKTQQIIADCIANDRACIRFLVARANDLEKSSVMLKEATEYRKKMKTDEILDAPFPMGAQVKAKYHHCYHRHDKEGRPVYYEQTGQLDIPLLQKLWNPDQMLHYHTHTTEYFRRFLFPAASVRAGKRIDQLTSIIDLNGLGRHHLTKAAYNFLSSVSKVDQLIYPEVLGRMVIINAGLIFSIAWAIIKPWLEERTKAKISIIRGDGKEELLKFIDADQLPRQFGGTCECGPTNIVQSPDMEQWLILAATGLEAQLKARAAMTSTTTGETTPAPLPSPTSPVAVAVEAVVMSPSSTSSTPMSPSSPSSTISETPEDIPQPAAVPLVSPTA